MTVVGVQIDVDDKSLAELRFMGKKPVPGVHSQSFYEDCIVKAMAKHGFQCAPQQCAC